MEERRCTGRHGAARGGKALCVHVGVGLFLRSLSGSGGLGLGQSARGTGWQGDVGKRRQDAGVEQALRAGGKRAE